MKLLRPLPNNRTLDQIRNHYEVEKSLAARLKNANRSERSEIFRGMYDELFRLVPDHPRLTRRENDTSTARANLSKLRLLRRFLRPSQRVVEFAPGDCQFAHELCTHVSFVGGIDISDQRRADLSSPKNFELVLYDGYHLNLADKADVVFSDQFLEHLHPDDVEHHFRLVHGLLSDSGAYVFRTPHRFNGPHDISRYFSDEPEGFHLKEWTYAEFGVLLRKLGFSSWHGLLQKKGFCFRIPFPVVLLFEAILRGIPKRLRRAAIRLMFSGISMVVVK